MITHLAYGKQGIDLEINDAWQAQVVEPRFVPGEANPMEALRQSLKNPIGSLPLHDLVKTGMRVGIIVNDITRATPTPMILDAILEELALPDSTVITLFIGLGTHRPNTTKELESMLGERLSNSYRIVQNNAFDRSTQVRLGTSSRGNEVWINSELMACPVKILTGFIEPHFFAGFSGGGKALMPGMGGLNTIMANHNAQNIAHPNATWGVTWGNPIWEEIREIAHLAGASFLVNVTLNCDKQITGVFSGDLDEAHAKGCAFVKETAMVPVEQPFDIVLTTNSGYPLDLNLYQSVKGMSAAAQVVRPGGAIVIATECWDGIPEHGLYGQILHEAGSPQAVLDRVCAPGFSQQDQWQVQTQAQIQLKSDVFVHSGNLSREQIRRALLKPAPDLGKTLAELVERYGPAARLCVLPEGPLTIPYLN